MKPDIVCDTGPLIALSLIDCLEIFSDMFAPIVPEAVVEEWEVNPHDDKRVLHKDFKRIPVCVHDSMLRKELDSGEAAVIQVASDYGISMVLIDERKARQVARTKFKLQPIGTARVLVEAKRIGRLSSIQPCFAELRRKSYRISDSIITWALKNAGECY